MGTALVMPVRLDPELWRALLALKEGEVGRRPPEARLSDAAWDLYAPIAARTGTPFLIAQVGQSLDGRVATLSGDARDVSGCDGLVHLHRCRALVDAVVVGVGTVEADDPSLTVRLVEGRHPARVVIDPNGRMSPDARMLCDDGPPPIIIQSDTASARRGIETIGLPKGRNGFDPADIQRVLVHKGFNRVLLEGGGRTIAHFLGAGVVNRLHVSVAPIIIGSGPAGLSLPPIQRLSQALRPEVSVYDIGSDILFDCRFDAKARAAAAE